MNKYIYVIFIIYFNFSIVFGNTEINIDNPFFFEDIFLLRQCHNYQNFGINNMVDTVIDDIIDNIIGDFSTEEKIDNFNNDIGFSLFDIPNYARDKNNIYKEITSMDDNIYYEDDYNEKFFHLFNSFAGKIGNNIIMEAYNRYESTDIYSTDKYSLHYYKLLNFFLDESEEEITDKTIENWITEMMQDCSDIKNNIIKDDLSVIAILFREMKTVNKLLFGRKLSKLDLFFNDIFCESDITLLYNIDVLINSISSIMVSQRNYEITSTMKEINRSQIEEIFNKNQTISENMSLAYLQSMIKYYTNNNNSNKFVGVYDTFNAITSYIYYHFNNFEIEFNNNKRENNENKKKENNKNEKENGEENKDNEDSKDNKTEKKFKFKGLKDNYAMQAFDYLMEFVDKNNRKSYNDLDSINLTELDDIIKQNIFTIYEQVTGNDEILKKFFSGMFQIFEYFSVKNSLNYRKYLSENASNEFIDYKENPKEMAKAVDELRKLKIIVETVNDIIYQINIKEGMKTIYNPKEPNSMIYLKFYMIIKQDELIDNTNNFLEDISELKKIYKSINKLTNDEISMDLFYKDSSDTLVIDNESIGGIEGSFMNNFTYLLEAVLKKIREEEFYSKRCMSKLNHKDSTMKENENYRNFISSKYQILPKIYYDIKNYYFDLGSDCSNNKNEMLLWNEQFANFCFPYIFCANPDNYEKDSNTDEKSKSGKTADSKETKDNEDKFLIFYNIKNNTLGNLRYDDIRIKINSIDSFESNEIDSILNNIKAYLEENYIQERIKSLYDLKNIYEKILYFDKFIFQNLPYNKVETFKISMDPTDLDLLNGIFNIKIKYKDILMEHVPDDIKNNSVEDAEDAQKEKFMDTMDVIINDNEDMLFDNYIDKNVYQFSCDTNYYTEAKNKYELRKTEYLNHNYIIKNVFVRYLIENTILYQNVITLFNENDIYSKINEEAFNSDIYSYASKRFIDTKDIPFYFFNYGIDEYVQYINKHHYNTIMDIVSKNETLKTEFINTFENNNSIDTNKFSPEVTNNNLTKLIMMQDILVKYLNDNPIPTSSLKKREEDNKEEENKENENKEDDNKVDEIKEDVKNGNVKNENVKNEEVKKEDNKNENVKKEGIKTETNTSESNNNNSNNKAENDNNNSSNKAENDNNNSSNKAENDNNKSNNRAKNDNNKNNNYSNNKAENDSNKSNTKEQRNEDDDGESKKPDIDSKFWNKMDEYFSNEMKSLITIIKVVEAVSDYHHDRKIAKKIYEKQKNAAKNSEENKEHHQEKVDKNKGKTYTSANTTKKNPSLKKSPSWYKGKS
ncbi:hypothetical protein U3516DRAFT_571530 [Neocallimastix sp. 'constans']